MPEEFTLQQIKRQRTTIDLNKWLVHPGRKIMNCLSDQFFPGAALSRNQNCRGFMFSNFANLTKDLQQSRTVADHLDIILFPGQTLDLASQHLGFKSQLYNQMNGIGLERLLDIVVRANF